jgi:hypothetical protein
MTFLVSWVTVISPRCAPPSYKKVVPGFMGKYSSLIVVVKGRERRGPRTSHVGNSNDFVDMVRRCAIR